MVITHLLVKSRFYYTGDFESVFIHKTSTCGVISKVVDKNIFNHHVTSILLHEHLRVSAVETRMYSGACLSVRSCVAHFELNMAQLLCRYIDLAKVCI